MLKLYESYGSRTLVYDRWGEIGNGLKSNNRYHMQRDWAGGDISASEGWNEYQPVDQKTMNRLYSKFVEKVTGQQGELLTAAVEWKQSLDMVTRRTLWLIDSYKSFRRFDLPETINKLYKPVVGKRYRYRPELNERGFATRRLIRETRRPTTTETWLEYWMGWAPVMGDIHNALNVLSREFPNQHVSAAVGYDDEYYLSLGEGDNYGYRRNLRKGVIGFYADCQVTNYNLHLANQMGLINPLETAWQVIPFSFVVDWFANVGQVLGALTDFAGLSLSNGGVGILQTREGSYYQIVDVIEWDGPHLVRRKKVLQGTSGGVTRERIPGTLSKPQLTLKFDRLSLTRAATAVSLLREIFLRPRS